ncbi:hypothetical protein [Prosthecobacter sp.]|uniref:hypothetical protein n=1 Tax=Prosthecobacter sp. TaxID=1965333 RepID=UPI003782FFE7
MHLVQILLPLYDNQHEKLDAALYAEVKAELTEQYGGLTAHIRSPAEGRWKEAGNEVRDEIIIYEVMTDTLDPAWWHAYRRELEARFHQAEIVIRALPMQML